MHLVEDMNFCHIDDFDLRSKQRKLKQLKQCPLESMASVAEETAWSPERLDNGKWACNHRCRDKTA